MDTLLLRLRELVHTDTVIGKPIVADGVTLIPVSRISVGFGAGGGGKTKMDNQGGAGGVRVEPLGFVVVSEGKAQILPLQAEEPALYKLVDILPDVWDTVQSLMDGKKGKKDD